MNAIIENLLTRRSTRAFLQKEIPDNELNEILQAAIYAPSGMGKQTWKFTVLCNQEKIQQLAEIEWYLEGKGLMRMEEKRYGYAN